MGEPSWLLSLPLPLPLQESLPMAACCAVVVVVVERIKLAG